VCWRCVCVCEREREWSFEGISALSRDGHGFQFVPPNHPPPLVPPAPFPLLLQFSKFVVKEVLDCVSDKRPVMRTSVFGLLDAWVEHGGVTHAAALEKVWTPLVEALACVAVPVLPCLHYHVCAAMSALPCLYCHVCTAMSVLPCLCCRVCGCHVCGCRACLACH
jgi:hypothetical protein